MLEDMHLRGLSARTQESYLRAVRQLAALGLDSLRRGLTTALSANCFPLVVRFVEGLNKIICFGVVI
jgi:hypothetical protein